MYAVWLLPILTFQGSDQITAQKAVALLAFVIVLLGSVLALLARWRSLPLPETRLLQAGILLFVMLVSSAIVTVAKRGSMLNWSRDALPYLLLGAAPFIGVMLGGRVSRRAIEFAFTLVGLFSSVAYITDWVQRRAVGDLSAGYIGLGSTTLISALFSYALVRGLLGPRVRMAWAAVAAGTSGALLVSGSRTGLALTAAVLTGAVMARRRRRLGAFCRRVALFLIGAVIVIVGAAWAVGVSLSFLGGRLASIGSLSSPADGSLTERATETKLAWETFLNHPIFGQGLGILFNTVRINGQPRSSFTMDTGVLFLAKFGMIGVVVLAVAAGLFIKACRTLPAGNGAREAVICFASISVALLPLSLVSEDKGAAIAVMALCSIVTAELEASRQGATRRHWEYDDCGVEERRN